MNENIKIMLEKLARDEESLKKLAAVRDPDEAYAIVSAIQGGYTKEEFVETMKTLDEQLNQDLSENDLAHTSGGGIGMSEVISGSVISGGILSGALGSSLAGISIGAASGAAV